MFGGLFLCFLDPMYVFIFLFKFYITEWPLIGNSCSHGLRYVSKYKYLIVNLVLPHLGFRSWNFFLIAPFSDHCRFVPSYYVLLLLLYMYMHI